MQRVPNTRRCVRLGIATPLIAAILTLVAWSPARGAQDPAGAPAATEQDPPAGETPTEEAAAAIPNAETDPRIELYVQKCASCHTVGRGDRVGPDLAGVHARRDRAWLTAMIATPSRLLARDPEARRLLSEYDGVKMPDLGLTAEQTADLIDLITLCSTTPCELAGRFVPVADATDDDVALGGALFIGTEPLSGGGIPCLSCHAVGTAVTSIPGGTAAVDLTHSFARLGDEGLDAALRNPVFPVMNKVFGDHPLTADEAFALRAFLDAANRGEETSQAALSLPLFGSLGAGLILVVLNLVWSRRLAGVRRPLTHRLHPRSRSGAS